MPYAERCFICPGCGQAFMRRAAAEAKPTCVNCGIQRSVDSMMQQHNRRGPYYDRWALGLARAAQRALTRAERVREIDSTG